MDSGRDFRYIEHMSVGNPDISHIRFTSTVFPSAEDIVLWDSLSAEEKRAVIARELHEAEASGLAPKQTMAEIIAEARTELGHELQADPAR
jgi:hypothetical protein